MVTWHIMEFHTIIIEVVEHGKTGLIPLSVVRLRSSSSETSRSQLTFSIIMLTTDPPVWDHSTLLWFRPLGHLMFPLLTLPPVQKNLWPSRATRFLNSVSLASLSMLRDLMPLARQKLSPCCLVKLLHPILQLTKKFCPPNWWLGECPPPHLPPANKIYKIEISMNVLFWTWGLRSKSWSSLAGWPSISPVTQKPSKEVAKIKSKLRCRQSAGDEEWEDGELGCEMHSQFCCVLCYVSGLGLSQTQTKKNIDFNVICVKAGTWILIILIQFVILYHGWHPKAIVHRVCPY